MVAKIRSPRLRAQNAKLAEPGSPDLLPIEKFNFSLRFWSELRDAFASAPALGVVLDSYLAKYPQVLEDIASETRRADAQGVPSTPRARHSLDRLAKAAATAAAEPAKSVVAARQLSTLDDLAQVLLDASLRRLDRLPTEPNLTRWLYDREKVDWKIVSAAARDAASYQSSGPYPNTTLAVLVMQLVDLFETITGLRATYSIERRYAQSSRPGSAAARFVSTCTRHILPEARDTTVLRYLEAEISTRRKARKNGPELWDSRAA